MTGQLVTGTMIDSETLSLGSRALPWEIGAVRFSFDPGAAMPVVAFGPRIHALIDYSGLSTRGFDIDFNTVRWTNGVRRDDPLWGWWRDTQLNGEDRKAPEEVQILSPGRLWRALDEITGESDPVFFRNSAFDPPVLENLFMQTGQGDRLPWHRRRQSDTYSYVNLAKLLHGFDDDLPAGARHNAVSDCLGQIGQLVEVLQVLGIKSIDPLQPLYESPSF